MLTKWGKHEERRYAIAVAVASEIVNQMGGDMPKAELFQRVTFACLRGMNVLESELSEARSLEPSVN